LDDRFYRNRLRLQSITLTKSQKQILVNHANSENPNESCAILFGKKDDQNTQVQKIFLTENIEKSPVNFTISAEQILEADNMEKKSSMKIIGIFHSHPNSDAFPSETDKKFMEINPGIWLIYSGISNDFRGFVLSSKLNEVKVVFN
jgi:proteasome lid subunit RPN8/RPN11